jgi:hypothetical protein
MDGLYVVKVSLVSLAYMMVGGVLSMLVVRRGGDGIVVVKGVNGDFVDTACEVKVVATAGTIGMLVCDNGKNPAVSSGGSGALVTWTGVAVGIVGLVMLLL